MPLPVRGPHIYSSQRESNLMKQILLGVALGYIFHDAIDKFVRQVSSSVEKPTDMPPTP